ncbi:SDR family NAD(P)-dependent oxidoreductase [Luedemannella flava]|uniref:SDR family NAD(P)-dependent oxidoreductase n=1 Tax=Luedemannella flava TaxID=349316 RepID=A0ABN2LXS6_9ACTN
MSDAPAVIITGGRGSIGRATVARLAARGCRVVALDREPLPPQTAALVAHELTVDLLDDAAVGAALATVDETPSHVIGIAGGGDAEELSQADPATEALDIFARVVAANLHIAFVTIRHTVPLLRRATGSRSITLVGSINAYGGYGAPGYSAAKAGLSGLVNALATPLGAEGISISCVALGTVDTDNLRHLDEVRGLTYHPDRIAARAPLRRILTPDEVAAALVAFALDTPGLTGTTVTLDNGQTRIR